jgi:cobalt-zinc-cadmium efflux system outer membrane protein
LVGPPSLDADIFTTTDQFEEQEARVSGALRWRGEGQAGQREARATRALADARLILAQWRLAGDVRNAWWAAVLANQSLLFEQELRELVAERLEATKNLVAEGLAADLDLAQARSDLELAEQSVARARLQRATALSLLMSLTGENVKLPSDDLPQAEPRIADLVLAEHPVVKIASLSEQQAQASADRLGYEARPRISASLGARRERSPVDGRFEDSVLVGVSVPLGKNPRTQADQAAAQTSATIAAAQARRAEIRLGAELKLAEQRIALTQAQLKSAERSAQALEGALELTRRGYEEGEFSYITLSQARTRWAEARRAMIQAQIAQRASISAYNQAAGALPR